MYRVTPFFNNWLPATRSAMEAETKREVQARAMEHNPFLNGYRDGDPLVRSMVGTLEIKAGDIMEALETAFERLSRDTRPNGANERSLSVGDVLKVETDTGERWYSCERTGWREIIGHRLFKLEVAA